MQARQPIRLAGSPLGKVRHVCALFANDEEEYRVLLPFILEGLSCGDRAIHVVNPGQRQEHLRRLAAEGIDTNAHQTSGQLQVQANTDVYLQGGRFDQNRMLATFEEIAKTGRTTEGYPMSRIVCRMDWASGNQSRIANVIEFESRVNDVWNRYDDVVICTYHLSQFSGDAVIDIMRTHPLVLIGAHLQQNPFFTPTDEFLREYRGRRTGPKSHV
jgi:MEDS: MEthanogen/methylotroph, DcmR Sensory domain